MLLGIGQSIIALIFYGSVATPAEEIMWPRYSTWLLQKSYLLALAYSSLIFKISNTFFKWPKWSNRELL
jgi:hypothetical protein